MTLPDRVNSKHKCPEIRKVLRSLREFSKVIVFGASAIREGRMK